MPKCLKCDLDNVPEDHALRCPMRNHICTANPYYYPYTSPQPLWYQSTTPTTGGYQFHTTCGSGCNHS